MDDPLGEALHHLRMRGVFYSRCECAAPWGIALPAIADAVGDRLTVLADGGIRSGLDVVRMLALGAKGVLLGRAWAYALAGGGGAGVSHVLQLIDAEMRVAMSLTGVTRVEQISRDILVRD